MHYNYLCHCRIIAAHRYHFFHRHKSKWLMLLWLFNGNSMLTIFPFWLKLHYCHSIVVAILYTFMPTNMKKIKHLVLMSIGCSEYIWHSLYSVIVYIYFEYCIVLNLEPFQELIANDRCDVGCVTEATDGLKVCHKRTCGECHTVVRKQFFVSKERLAVAGDENDGVFVINKVKNTIDVFYSLYFFNRDNNTIWHNLRTVHRWSRHTL